MMHVQRLCYYAKTFQFGLVFVFSDWTVLTQKRTGFCSSNLNEHLLGVVLKEQVSWYYLKMFSCKQHTEEFEDHP